MGGHGVVSGAGHGLGGLWGGPSRARAESRGGQPALTAWKVRLWHCSSGAWAMARSCRTSSSSSSSHSWKVSHCGQRGQGQHSQRTPTPPAPRNIPSLGCGTLCSPARRREGMEWTRCDGDGGVAAPASVVPGKVTTCPRRVSQQPGAEPWAAQGTPLAPGPAVPIRAGRGRSLYL